PWITLKLAVSADGAVADPTGRHRWITGPESRAHVHHLRANADAIAVGSGTVLADDPSLTVRDATPPRIAPRRGVFDRHLRVPTSARLVATAREIPSIVYTLGAPIDPSRRRSLEGAGVRVESEPTSLGDALKSLRLGGVRALFVEAGPGLSGALLR